MRRSILLLATMALTLMVSSAAFLAFFSLVLFEGVDAQPAHAAAATTYTSKELGTFEGNTIARGVNTSGQVVGQSQKRIPNVIPALQLRAFLWEDGSMADLGTLTPEGPASAARGINDEGQVVGFSRVFASGTQQEAFVAKKDAGGTMLPMSPLGTLPKFPSSEAFFPSSEAFAINEKGQIVGRSSENASPPGGPQIPISSGRAFLYQDGKMKDLGALLNDSLQEDPYSEAWAINDSGQVVGESGTNEDQGQAFLYSDGSMKGLGTLPDQPYSEAFGINNSGQIVGWSYSSRTDVHGRAFIYRNGKMEDLGTLPADGTLPEDTYSMARAIDDHGRVVGQSRAASGPNPNRAFLWENGEMKDLNSNSLVTSSDPSLKRLLDAYAISESGKIVGSALNQAGQTRGFLLTPNDTTTPNTMATISPEPNTAGWNNDDVTVTLDATDEGGSNVKEITYSATGAQPIEDQPIPSDTTEIKITAEGETTLTYYATDHAGNVEDPKTLTVKIDKSTPSVSCSVSPSKLSTPANNHKLVDIEATVDITDSGSGPSGFKLISVTSSQPDSGLGPDDVAKDIQDWKIDTDDTTGQLRTERYRTERTYTLTYRGYDVAGNTKDCQAMVKVPKGG